MMTCARARDLRRLLAIALAAATTGCASLNPFGGEEEAAAPAPREPRGPQLVHYPVPAGGYRSFSAARLVERVCVDPEGAHALRVSFERAPSIDPESDESERTARDAAPGECVLVEGQEFSIENDGEVDVEIQFILPGEEPEIEEPEIEEPSEEASAEGAA